MPSASASDRRESGNGKEKPIIYLAAIAGVDGTQDQPAGLDGGARLRQMRQETLPGILPVISLQLILNVGNLLNVG